MSKGFRKDRPETMPTAGSLDELMEDPPAISARGSLAAYADGSKVRRKVYIGLVLGVAAAVVGGYTWAAHLQHEKDNPTAHYTVAKGAESEIRPRSMEWNEGYARLALSREPPGINQIVLPDRLVELADGVDTAQFKVNVVDGKTVEFKVLTGDVKVFEK
ncbi:MAG: hypothetical protein AAF721_10850 [Myxococcota bacterium]